MKIDNLIRILAGSMTLLSVALVYFVSPWWLLGPSALRLGVTMCRLRFDWLVSDGVRLDRRRDRGAEHLLQHRSRNAQLAKHHRRLPHRKEVGHG